VRKEGGEKAMAPPAHPSPHISEEISLLVSPRLSGHLYWLFEEIRFVKIFIKVFPIQIVPIPLN
jgi:hypothetical protein